MRKILVASEDVYGRLVVVEEVPMRGRYRFVLVRCQCGTYKTVRLNDLRSGKTESCGCYRNQRVRETITKHGLSKTPEYRAWWDMIARCTNSDHPSFVDYGARGITVFDKWLTNFELFLSHIGTRPNRTATLDRIDNNNGYVPGNVRWVSRQINQSNRRNSKRWVIEGVMYMTLRNASETLGVSQSVLKSWCTGRKCYRSGRITPPKPNCYKVNVYE